MYNPLEDELIWESPRYRAGRDDQYLVSLQVRSYQSGTAKIQFTMSFGGGSSKCMNRVEPEVLRVLQPHMQEAIHWATNLKPLVPKAAPKTILRKAPRRVPDPPPFNAIRMKG